MKEVTDDPFEEEVTILRHGRAPQMRKLSTEEEFDGEKDPEQLEIIIKDWVSDRTIRIETHFFNVRILSKETGKDWLIQRRYSDF